jgi:hypothetical protein
LFCPLGLAQGFSPAKNQQIQGALAPGLLSIDRNHRYPQPVQRRRKFNLLNAASAAEGIFQGTTELFNTFSEPV